MVSAWNFVISKESRRCLLTKNVGEVLVRRWEEEEKEIGEDGLYGWKRMKRMEEREGEEHTQQPPPSPGPDKPPPSYKYIQH
jgi:hypothetical protein